MYKAINLKNSFSLRRLLAEFSKQDDHYLHTLLISGTVSPVDVYMTFINPSCNALSIRRGFFFEGKICPKFMGYLGNVSLNK